MTPYEESEAIYRIFNVIKNYYYSLEDQFSLTKDDLFKSYLAKHLSTQDLQLWERLEEQNSLSKSLFSTNTNEEFEHLLHQFKRSAYSLIESWYESHCLN